MIEFAHTHRNRLFPRELGARYPGWDFSRGIDALLADGIIVRTGDSYAIVPQYQRHRTKR